MAAWRIWKRLSLGLLVGYAVLLLAETVLIQKPFTGEHLKLELLWSWKQWNVQKEQILSNVVMFIPVGVLGELLWRWRGVLVGISLSIFIEILQLITSRGLCEFDDVFHNVIGAVIGVGVVMIGRKLFKGESE